MLAKENAAQASILLPLKQAQGEGQYEMTDHLICQWHNDSGCDDGVAYWCIQAHVYQYSCKEKQKEVHVLKVPDNLVHADEESSLFKLFRRGTPLHMDGEKVTENGFA